MRLRWWRRPHPDPHRRIGSFLEMHETAEGLVVSYTIEDQAILAGIRELNQGNGENTP